MRILDGAVELAHHVRSYHRHRPVLDPAHQKTVLELGRKGRDATPGGPSGAGGSPEPRLARSSLRPRTSWPNKSATRPLEERFPDFWKFFDGWHTKRADRMLAREFS